MNQEANNNYQNILNATAGLMVENGYWGTSIRMIAEKVGIRSSTIFHYFKNKDEILRTILDKHYQGFVSEIREMVEDNSLSGIEKMKKLFSSYLVLISNEKNTVMVYFNESKHLKGEYQLAFKKLERKFFELVTQILVQIQEENSRRFAGIDLRLFARVIYGICNWSLFWYQEDGKFAIDEIVDQYMRILNLDKKQKPGSV